MKTPAGWYLFQRPKRAAHSKGAPEYDGTSNICAVCGAGDLGRFGLRPVVPQPVCRPHYYHYGQNINMVATATSYFGP